MPDFTPNLTGQIFAQSLGSIVDKFEKHQEENKNRARLDAAYGTIAEQLGFDKNYLKSTSLEQKKGMVEGKQMAATLEHLKAQSEQQAYARQLEADRTAALTGFATTYANRMQGGLSSLPMEQQSDYFENPEKYPQGPPQPDAQGALAEAMRSYPGAFATPQFDNSVAAILRANQMGKAGTPEFDPTLKMMRVQRSDGTWVEVPVGTTSRGGATWMQTLVPKDKEQRTPGEGPKVSKDGKFFWDESTQAWKPLHADPTEAFKALLGEGAPPAAPEKKYTGIWPFRTEVKPTVTNAPAGKVLQFKRNPKTGEMEEQ